MNKQEAIEKIEELKKYSCGALGDDWISLGIDKALNVVKQLDEPEKPVLTKAEAEWVENLTEFFDTPDALYYITRCGYSEYPFTFDFWGDTYELPIEEGIEYGELNKIRERLVNAVLYGYEVRKEKLYEVFLKRTGAQLGVCIPDGEDKAQFTEEELQEYGFDNLDVYEVEEVE